MQYQIHIIYLSIISILLISLFSPNIVYLIHKHWFIWKKHKNLINSTLRKNYLFTVNRNGDILNLIDCHTHPLLFLAVEKELGHNTIMLNYKELNDEDYEYACNLDLK